MTTATELVIREAARPPDALRNWPIAPAYAEAWDAYHARQTLPASGVPIGHAPGSPGAPGYVIAGWWIYLVPPQLWASVPSQVKKALTALYKNGGFRSMVDIDAADDGRLLAVENMGPTSLTALREWVIGLKRGLPSSSFR